MAEPVRELELKRPGTGPGADAEPDPPAGPGDAADSADSTDSADATDSADDGEALRRVLLNAVFLLFAYIIPRVATFAAVVVAARAVGVTAFGAYGTAAALAVILSIAATLGMMQLLVRDLARAPDDAPGLLAAANMAKAGSAALMLAALAILTLWVLDYPPRVVAAALLLGIGYAIGAYAENLGAYFQSIERMDVWMQAQAAFGLVSGALGIGLVLATGSIVWFAAAPAVGQLAALGWLVVRAPRPLRLAWDAPWPVVRRLLRSLALFAVAFIALTAYYKVDILLVEWWRGEGEAGVYAAAYKFVDVAHALALVIATAVYPRLARLAPGRTGSEVGHRVQVQGSSAGPPAGQPASPWAARRVVELLLLAGVPAAALLWLLRQPVIGGLFGADYGASVPVLALLAPVLPVLALNALGTYILAAARRMTAVAALYGAALGLNVALNALLIPRLGAVGAALAMLVAEVALAATMLAVLHRAAASAPGPRPVLAVAGVVLGAGLLAAAGLPPLATAGAYSIVVALLYWRLRVVPARELALLRRAVRP